MRQRRGFARQFAFLFLLAAVLGSAFVYGTIRWHDVGVRRDGVPREAPLAYEPVQKFDFSGLQSTLELMQPWRNPNSLDEIRNAFDGVGQRSRAKVDAFLASGQGDAKTTLKMLVSKAAMHLYDGQASVACEVIEEARRIVEGSPDLRAEFLYTIIYFKGIASLRRGEDENCVDCRGEGACIFPLRPTAVHTRRAGSEQAVQLFTEYLDRFPHDPGAKWLLNLAHMTLGDYPKKVPTQHLLDFSTFGRDDDIGRFKDIGHLVGLHRFNMAGGAVMDDFDNDGLLDLAVTDWDNSVPISLFRNKGDGTFEDRSKQAGLSAQVGGLNLTQTDYNNDGRLDLFITRGAWMPIPMRPSLLRNNPDGTFTDVTAEAGMMIPSSSNSSAWADFDNDGFLDVFVCNESGPNRLFHNRRDGTFEEIGQSAGVAGKAEFCKGACWIDYDRDGCPDLFVNYMSRQARLFHNNGNGSFTDVTERMGITGPRGGFSCWSFDYDNDGWPDIFATCYERTLDDVVLDMQGAPTRNQVDRTRLFRNLEGKGFQDVSAEVGVNKVFSTMGCNFADFDNDGFLDFYLGTGEPSLATLVPNRMFRNVGGKKFAEITATAGTGHLQKGHAVACGDWDRDGNVDMFVEVGGAVPGDRFHSALFQNPGHDNNWVTVRLVGKKTNRAAFGARIKVVTEGPDPLTVHRFVGYGSSFGGNPLEQTIGLGKGKKIARIEVDWPTSATTQRFTDVAVNQSIEITEFAKDFRKRDYKRIPVPKE